jgi:hypothetical protein
MFRPENDAGREIEVEEMQREINERINDDKGH